MNKWNNLSFADQRMCVVKVFNALVKAGILSNKGARNAKVIRGKIESMFGCTITTNHEVWQVFVNESIPASVENAETRNARKLAEAMSVSIDLGL
jgi:hypothetical protein